MHRSKKAVAAALGAGGLLLGAGLAGAAELADQANAAAEDKTVDRDSAPSVDAQAKAAAHRQNETDEVTTDDVDDSRVASEGAGERPTDTHGYDISQLATTTDAEGRDKGEEISTAARSNGAATASEHAPSSEQAPSSDSDGAGRSAEARAGR